MVDRDLPVDRRATLTVQLLSFWHAGGGIGGDYGADAVPRTEDALPIIAGRHLLGLLRHKIMFLVELGVASQAVIDTLFGVSTELQGRSRFESTAGVLIVDSARLPGAWRAHFASLDPAARKTTAAPLFRRFGMTAMTDAGVARDHTLRHVEVTVPMTLAAEVRLDASRYQHLADPAPRADLEAALTRAAGLVQHVGRHRTRGLGRARLGFGAWQEVR